MKIVLSCIAIAACLYFFYKKGKRTEQMAKTVDLSNVPKETIDGILKLEDVKNFFKSQNLNEKTNVPFISKKLESLYVIPTNILNKPGYETLISGVNFENNIKIMKIIYAKGLDEQLESAFAGNDLIVLS